MGVGIGLPQVGVHVGMGLDALVGMRSPQVGVHVGMGLGIGMGSAQSGYRVCMYSFMSTVVMIMESVHDYAYRVIRLTSPNLNYLIGIGVILVYISAAVFFVQPTTNSSVAGRLCIVSIKYCGEYAQS